MVSCSLAMGDPEGMLQNSKQWRKLMGRVTLFRHCRQTVSVTLFLLINLRGIRGKSLFKIALKAVSKYMSLKSQKLFRNKWLLQEFYWQIAAPWIITQDFSVMSECPGEDRIQSKRTPVVDILYKSSEVWYTI